jgi:hypothetical protein
MDRNLALTSTLAKKYLEFLLSKLDIWGLIGKVSAQDFFWVWDKSSSAPVAYPPIRNQSSKILICRYSLDQKFCTESGSTNNFSHFSADQQPINVLPMNFLIYVDLRASWDYFYEHFNCLGMSEKRIFESLTDFNRFFVHFIIHFSKFTSSVIIIFNGANS